MPGSGGMLPDGGHALDATGAGAGYLEISLERVQPSPPASDDGTYTMPVGSYAVFQVLGLGPSGAREVVSDVELSMRGPSGALRFSVRNGSIFATALSPGEVELTARWRAAGPMAARLEDQARLLLRHEPSFDASIALTASTYPDDVLFNDRNIRPWAVATLPVGSPARIAAVLSWRTSEDGLTEYTSRTFVHPADLVIEVLNTQAWLDEEGRLMSGTPGSARANVVYAPAADLPSATSDVEALFVSELPPTSLWVAYADGNKPAHVLARASLPDGFELTRPNEQAGVLRLASNLLRPRLHVGVRHERDGQGYTRWQDPTDLDWELDDPSLALRLDEELQIIRIGPGVALWRPRAAGFQSFVVLGSPHPPHTRLTYRITPEEISFDLGSGECRRVAFFHRVDDTEERELTPLEGLAVSRSATGIYAAELLGSGADSLEFCAPSVVYQDASFPSVSTVEFGYLSGGPVEERAKLSVVIHR